MPAQGRPARAGSHHAGRLGSEEAHGERDHQSTDRPRGAGRIRARRPGRESIGRRGRRVHDVPVRAGAPHRPDSRAFGAGRPHHGLPFHPTGGDVVAGSLNEYMHAEFEKSRQLLDALSSDEALHRQVLEVVAVCVQALRRGNKILFAGNGGSAADAQHWAGELVSRFNYDRPGLPGIALTTDTSILTAIGNDYGYEYLFARQVQALGVKGDVLFAISTSGNSKNILRGIEAAHAAALEVIGFTG